MTFVIALSLLVVLSAAYLLHQYLTHALAADVAADDAAQEAAPPSLPRAA